MTTYRAFAIRLPSGVRYWTVLDDRHRVVTDVDEYLIHRRLGTDAAESTTQAYAIGLGLFLDWCDSIGKSPADSVPYLGRFVYWLQHASPATSATTTTQVRAERRVNAVLSAVRGYLRHQASIGRLPHAVLAGLYDDFTSPVPGLADLDPGFQHRPRARHRLQEPPSLVANATDDEVLKLLTAATNPRDRFIIIAMWRMGLRRGEMTGLRREDVHFVARATRLGCGVEGPHLHVRRRENPNRALAKSRRPRVVPADWLVVQAHDQYMSVLADLAPDRRSDFVLVNLFREPVGSAMRPDAINALLDRLSQRGGCDRRIRPHMLRHSFGTNTLAAGATLDVLKELLGHAWVASTEVYVHPSPERLRAAVEAVATHRTAGGELVGSAAATGSGSASTPGSA